MLKYESTIAASPSAVWDVLLDVAAWDDWNPTLHAVAGPLVPGTTVNMKLRLGPVSVPMRQRILTVDAPRHLVWRTINGVPGFMDVDREFILEPTDDGGTHLTQQETAKGPGRPVFMPLLTKSILAGYEQIASALAAQVAART